LGKVVGTKEYWVNELEKLSLATLRNPTTENRKSLSNWYERRISFEYDVSEIECIREVDSRAKAIEILIALSISGVKEFSEFLWDRQIEFRKKLFSQSRNNPTALTSINRFTAYHGLQNEGFSISEILKILTYLPRTDFEEFELSIKELAERELQDLDSADLELVKIVTPYLNSESDPELLLASCRFRKIGNWLERFTFAYREIPHRFEDKSSLVSYLQINLAYLETAILQTKATAGDQRALLDFLRRGHYLTPESPSATRANNDQLAVTAIRSFRNGGYSDEAFKWISQRMPNAIPSELIAAASEYPQADFTLLREVTKFLAGRKLWQDLIDKLENVHLNQLSELDFSNLVIASRETHNFELLLTLHEFKKITEYSLLARSAAEFLNAGQVETGMKLYDEVKDEEPTNRFKLSNTKVFLGNLSGEGLIAFDKIRRIDEPQYLLKIAKHLNASLAPLHEANSYLERAIELKDKGAASLYVEMNQGGELDRDILEMAASYHGDSIGKRELAKVLIKEDRRDEALKLALIAAETDDQAAHLLIYVLNENVALWAYKLYERDSEYSPEVFKSQFTAQGITFTPRYSALDNLQLHRLVREGAPKQSRISKATQSNVDESWVCREALGRYKTQGDWESLSCQNHRSRILDFQAEKMFPDLSHISWQGTRERIQLESTLLSVENKPNLARLFARREPRTWQKEAFNAWVSHGRHGIVEAATGSGKSMLGVMAALEAMDEGYAVVIVVPTRVLQQQWIKQYFLTLWDAPGAKIRTIGNTDGDYVRDVGQISAGTITIAVAKSLRENPSLNPAEGVKSLIIADEVHNYTSEISQNMLSENYSRRLGLTATLEPPQGRYPILSNYFGGDPIYRYDFSRAVKEKVISPYNLLTIGVPLEKEIARLYTDAYIRMKNSKDQLLELGKSTSNPDGINRVIDIFRTKGLYSGLINEYLAAYEESDEYLKNANSKAGAIRLVTDFIKSRGNTIVFSDLVATARNVQIIFKERGLDSEVISAEVPQSEREAIFRRLKSKSISALLSPKALDEGVDIEQLSTGVFAGASRRRLQIIQRLGRVLRISDSKQMPLLILIVADGTEEDPCMPNNSALQNSPFGIVHEQAVSRAHFKLEQEQEVREFLRKLASD